MIFEQAWLCLVGRNCYLQRPERIAISVVAGNGNRKPVARVRSRLDKLEMELIVTKQGET